MSTLFIILFTFGAGCFSNLGLATPFSTFLGYISPFRYSCEILMRYILDGKPMLVNYVILEFFNYTFGMNVCYGVLIG